MVSRAVSLLGLGLFVLGLSCTVDITEEDILRRRYRCDGDGACAAGWRCRAFALDTTGQRYCVHPCATDGECLSGEICGNEQFCAATCDASGDDVCHDVGFSCLRLNLQTGRSAGICHPDPVCDTSSDCDGGTCLTDSLLQVVPGGQIEAQASACAPSCSGGTGCVAGYACLRDALADLVESEGLVPPICVPGCGEDNTCPAGFRCLIDALTELYPEGDWSETDHRFCFAGLPGSFLTCRSDLDCLAGRCVTHPTTGLSGGRPYHVCALPCDAASCDDDRTACRNVEVDGAVAPYCLPRIDLQPCTVPLDCTGGQECLDFSQLIETSACAQSCTGLRDPACPAGYVCTPTTGGTHWGCFPGLPGFPCDRDEQCGNDGGEGTTCLGTGGTGADADRTCTKVCATNADCRFGATKSAATLCHAGICQPLGHDCGDPGVPYQCNATMECAVLLPAAEPTYVCSIPCGDGDPRPTGHGCPRGYGCSPLPQEGLGSVAYYCAPGYPPIMPCRDDTECLGPTGEIGTCASITGAPLASDGTCALSCTHDGDCAVGQSGSQTLVSFFCFPGAADAGSPGQCYTNPSLDDLVQESKGLQGTRCTADTGCETGYTCVSPLWKSSLGTDRSRRYCARTCVGQGDCDVEPFAHECVGVAGRHCEPATPLVKGRDFWEPCLDHRQCRYAFCYFPPEAVMGRCTAPCSTATDCPAGDFPDSVCNLAEHACVPQ